MKREPDVYANLRHELSDSRRWLDRVVVMGFAVLAGLAAVGFALLADGAFDWFAGMQARWWWFPLVWTPALTALVVWVTRRWFKAAGGSGVPQVLAALDPRTPEESRHVFVSLKLAAAKVALVTGGCLAGLSIGRQGPSVQVTAGVMFAARRWLSPNSGITPRELLVAGGAAGIAAAFNTPLGGIVFAIEELSRRIETKSSGLMMAGIVASGLVAVSVMGHLSLFGRVRVGDVGWSIAWPGFLVALACGLLGGLMARLIIASFLGMPDRFCAYRRKWPIRFAALCGLAVAVIAVLTQTSAVGGGHNHTRALLEDSSQSLPVVWTWLKFVATWLSAWAGVPGGLFGPALSIGAGVGADVAHLLDSPDRVALIALGMAAFLAAVTQTPITAMIIVMEMVDGYAMVLSLMAAALLASGVSRLISRPLYATLADLMLRRFEGTGLGTMPGTAPPAGPSEPQAPAETSPAPATPAPEGHTLETAPASRPT